MSKINFILSCLAGLFFLIFVSMNVIVSQSFHSDGQVQLTLTELAAKAEICSSEVSCPYGKNTSLAGCCTVTGLGTGYKN